jgi:hypothetical protein
MGTALALAPDLPRQWAQGQDAVAPAVQIGWKDKTLVGLATMALTRSQLHRLAKGDSPRPNASPLWTLVLDQLRSRRMIKRYRAWRQMHASAQK